MRGQIIWSQRSNATDEELSNLWRPTVWNFAFYSETCKNSMDLQLPMGKLCSHKLLKRSGLSREQQRVVLASAGSEWRLDKIEEIMKMLFHDVHEDRSRSQASGSGKGYKPVLSNPRLYGKDRRKGKGKFRAKPIMAADMDEESELDDGDLEYFGEEDYGAEDDEDELGDYGTGEEDECEENSGFDDEFGFAGTWPDEAHAAYALGFARGKGRAKGRKGKSKKGVMEKRGRCRDCGQLGHWKGDAICPKVLSGETPPYGGKSKGRGAANSGGRNLVPRRGRRE